MIEMSLSRWFRGIYLACILTLVACRSTGGETAGQSPLEKAAAEATAIIQQAQATALVLQAQAQATELISRADSTAVPDQPISPTPALVLPVPTTGRTLTTVALSQTPQATSVEPPSGQVELIIVSYAAEGAYIFVQFKAPPRVAQQWWQGMVSVTDEATGTVYDEIPVAPVIGPLIGKPVREGQLGYVMLVNTPPGLPSESLVTVILGDYRFEHVPVK